MNDEFNSIPNVDKNADQNYWLESLYTIPNKDVPI